MHRSQIERCECQGGQVDPDAKDKCECGGHFENDHSWLCASEEDWPKEGSVNHMRLEPILKV
jgi:hypothetical protein